MGLIQGFKGMILPTGVSLSASTASIGSGVEYQLEAYITPELASNNKIHWSASNNNVTVDENGLVTGVTDGTSVVTATTDYGGYTASCTFTVFTVPVTGVSLDTNKLTLTPGKTYQLTATITPSNATNKKVTWRSTNTSVATVDNNGLVTCIANGNAEIIVTTADGNYTDSCEIITDWAPTENTWVYLPLNGTLDRYGTKEGTVSAGSDIGWTDITSIAKGINFKGNTNSYVQINSVPEMNTDFTINFWIYLNGLSDAIMVERGTADSTNRDLHYVVRNSGHTADLGFYANDCPGTTALNTGTWYNLMATYNHTTREQKVYINGVINNTRTGSGDPAFGTGPLYIGCKKSYSSSNPTNGTMCRFILEDKIWTAEEGLEYYNLTKGIIFKDDINSYDELEYIQSDGNQYINTLYIPKVTSGFDINFEVSSKPGSYNTILGTRYDTANNAFWIGHQVSNGQSYGEFSPTNTHPLPFSFSTLNTKYTLTFQNSNLDKTLSDGTNNYVFNFTHNASYNLYLFAGNQQNSVIEGAGIKMYYCKIYDNLELVRDFIPARRKSDGVIGLYDKVEDKFYTNSGSGTFTAGPKVGVILNTNNISLTSAGQTYQLTATANPSSVGAQGYTWSSSDTSIATVSNTGLVTCVTPGECTITCTAIATGDTDTCSVKQRTIYYLLNSDEGINRYSELSLYGTQSIDNASTYWNGNVRATDTWGTHYKGFTEKIVGFEFIGDCTNNSYDGFYIGLAPTSDMYDDGSGKRKYFKNSLNFDASSNWYGSSSTGGISAGETINQSGSNYFSNTKNNSTTRVTFKGELVNGTWNIQISTAAGQSWTTTHTPNSVNSELHYIGFRTSRWYTGQAGRYFYIKLILE